MWGVPQGTPPGLWHTFVLILSWAFCAPHLAKRTLRGTVGDDVWEENYPEPLQWGESVRNGLSLWAQGEMFQLSVI